MAEEETMDCTQEFPAHYKVILDRLNEQRQQEQFTDITLIVDGHHFKAHKAVLAACSQFFYRFFQDFTQDPLVEIEGVSNLAFRHLIEFTYTAKLAVQSEEETNDVWKAAEYLQMQEAIKALDSRNKENSAPDSNLKAPGKSKAKKRKIAETSNVITETLPSMETEPVEIEVEITEGTIQMEDEVIETLEEVSSTEKPLKALQGTDTSDDSALALLADITSKYRQGEGSIQEDEEGENVANSPASSDSISKQEHLTSHSDESYKCHICNKRYMRESAWRQHLTFYHLVDGGSTKKQRPGKKIHVCQYCEKQFDHFGHFKEHLRKHTGEKPFECPNCHERFARNSTLKCHMTACQSGIGAKKGRKKLYECQVCSSVFNSWDQFKDHLVTHTGEKPNHCTICDVWFTQASELRKHHKDIHNIPERVVTEVVVPANTHKNDGITTATILEQGGQVHIVPIEQVQVDQVQVEQVIQIQMDPTQLNVEHIQQELVANNQEKFSQDDEEQVQVHHIEVEHLQVDQIDHIEVGQVVEGQVEVIQVEEAEEHMEVVQTHHIDGVQVNEVHVDNADDVQIDEVQDELVDQAQIAVVQTELVDQTQMEERETEHIGGEVEVQIADMQQAHVEEVEQQA
ncbi:zinc finger protein 131 isoform X2 [Latimeria chalumnae]|uniref:zinc finger protein 131 isoform X2 n=1 Tax=Latimeria chalumnae TaxID=7897 RepID=UPI0003C18EDD|nr:PREDICTED: zinc finger protein 131 isoform X2 [Latimeria chalumnae]|eukprot:XP_006011399.1 PREDICTED: zinc finger protein 131 isoform X2 [Latimeria chalumnae]